MPTPDNIHHWQAPYAGARALVVGGSGFIGRWVTKALADARADVVVTARSIDSATALFAGLNATARVLHHELRDRDSVRVLLDDIQPDVVFNLAGYGVDRSEQDQAELWLVNRDLPAWLADVLASMRRSQQPLCRLVHVGSALEYGDAGGDLDESTPGHPTVPYGQSKLAGTQAVSDAAARTGLRCLTARLFTVYGAGEHAGRLLPTLLHAASSGEAVALSAGTQQRDFTYVEDVAEGLLRLGASDAAPGSVLNLATGVLTRVRDFVAIAARVLKLRPEQTQFGQLPIRPEEMHNDPVSIARLKVATGWVPSTTIAEGVRRTAQYIS